MAGINPAMTRWIGHHLLESPHAAFTLPLRRKSVMFKEIGQEYCPIFAGPVLRAPEGNDTTEIRGLGRWFQEAANPEIDGLTV
jgi:hypothetical protein